jgi:hypothetical protein
MASPQEPVLQPAQVVWQDFDDEAVFETTLHKAAAKECENFVLEFGPNNAQIALDLKKEQFYNLLNEERRDANHPIRWM